MPRILSKEDGEYVAEVLSKLQSNPTQQDLDYLVEAHTYVGYLASVAQGAADEAEALRKYREAVAVQDIKEADPKATALVVEAKVAVLTYDFTKAEITARTQARKIVNLLSSIEQAINGIKHIEKNTGVNLPNGR